MNHLPASLIPPDDAARLRSLHQYRILNTTPEPIFDEYVALAAQLFNLPISLISLVDEQEVYFKANTGLPGVERVARPDSLCSAAILQDEVLAYTNLSEESCSLISPYVAKSAGLQFYAGATLRMPDGSNIGSLCVIGREARAITPEERELLTALAGLAGLTIELRRQYLAHNRSADWQVVQQELQQLLTDEAALVRYLTSRLGTISANVGEYAPMQRRLQALRQILQQHLTEFDAPGQA
ncbi:GAF domain-containing protein [Hymenobacter metallilatus]|uniref:GAF domain-containing protein n=1 Tax=Hymenobacter metallilatus TaxID=2493666 RepID=A0A428JMS7_9BACT|nr:GAF domain-containing protein [Hymenobacter metallilatus]RSK34552.1 GAF domain-containing protein [Hymenobacter metallilatus]